MTRWQMRLFRKGKTGKLERQLENRLKTRPDDRGTKFDLAVVYHCSGKRDEAIVLYEQLLPEPDSSQLEVLEMEALEGLVNLAILYYQKDRLEDALKSLGRVIKQAAGRKTDTGLLAMAYFVAQAICQSIDSFNCDEDEAEIGSCS